ncbi:MAG TPA: PfkB family carbohydrate kinase, partial [Planctomycetota bacterium]|nr:PfkB family carbohydrate kinase [Planctomycetota bacterium]
FRDLGVETEGVVASTTYRTVSKTRILAGDPHRTKQQLLRIDREPDAPPDAAAREALKERLRARLPHADAVIYSDYGYGTATPDVFAAAREAFRGRLQAADSRYRIGEFRGVDVATPNEDEAEGAVGFRIRDEAALERAGRLLLDRLEAPALLITRGNLGLSLFERDKPRVDVPASGGEVADVSGAGDTVISVLTLALAAGASRDDAARLANAAAGVVVTKAGAAVCAPSEFVAAAEAFAR